MGVPAASIVAVDRKILLENERRHGSNVNLNSPQTCQNVAVVEIYSIHDANL